MLKTAAMICPSILRGELFFFLAEFAIWMAVSFVDDFQIDMDRQGCESIPSEVDATLAFIVGTGLSVGVEVVDDLAQVLVLAELEGVGEVRDVEPTGEFSAPYMAEVWCQCSE